MNKKTKKNDQTFAIYLILEELKWNWSFICFAFDFQNPFFQLKFLPQQLQGSNNNTDSDIESAQKKAREEILATLKSFLKKSKVIVGPLKTRERFETRFSHIADPINPYSL